jgi:ABC-type thiamin/hydroxymethylpyrimidine transport system permease subunit
MRQRKYEVRDWVYIGLFGALWGGIELSLGTLLHVVFPPLANTFFTGIILTSIGCIIALCSRFFVPQKGGILLVGVITALLKLVSPGGVKLGPIVAIIMESALMEGSLFFFKKKRASGFMLAGSFALAWNFLHRFVMMRLLYGNHFMDVAVKMAKGGSRLFGIDEVQILAVLGILLVIQISAGIVSGLLAWKLGVEIMKRMESRYDG